jgi:hypothetical protein
MLPSPHAAWLSSTNRQRVALPLTPLECLTLKKMFAWGEPYSRMDAFAVHNGLRPSVVLADHTGVAAEWLEVGAWMSRLWPCCGRQDSRPPDVARGVMPAHQGGRAYD